MTPRYEAPWSTLNRLKTHIAESPNVTRAGDLGDRAYWIWEGPGGEGVSGVLVWVKGNIEFRQEIRGRFDGKEVGTAPWVAACEGVARDLDRSFQNGRVGDKVIQPHRIPKAFLLVLELYDHWKRKRGIRTESWWKDW